MLARVLAGCWRGVSWSGEVSALARDGVDGGGDGGGGLGRDQWRVLIAALAGARTDNYHCSPRLSASTVRHSSPQEAMDDHESPLHAINALRHRNRRLRRRIRRLHSRRRHAAAATDVHAATSGQ